MCVNMCVYLVCMSYLCMYAYIVYVCICLYVCIICSCVCMCVCMHIYGCLCMWVHVCMCACICIWMCISMYIYDCLCVCCVCMWILYVYVCVCIVHVCVHVPTHRMIWSFLLLPHGEPEAEPGSPGSGARAITYAEVLCQALGFLWMLAFQCSLCLCTSAKQT